MHEQDQAMPDETMSAPEAPGPVEVRAGIVLPLAVAVPAAVLATAYAVRGLGGGGLLDGALAAVMALVAVAHLVSLLEARTPLFVADELGVRLRRGRTWQGLPWSEIDAVEVLPRRGLRDGSLDVLCGTGAPLAVPLGLATRVTGVREGQADVVDALADLADGRTSVAEINGYEYVEDWAGAGGPDHSDTSGTPETAEHHEPGTEPDPEPDPGGPGGPGGRPLLRRGPGQGETTVAAAGAALSGVLNRVPDPRPLVAHAIDRVAARLPQRSTEPASSVAVGSSATPAPLRDPVGAVRAEIRSDLHVHVDDHTHGALALEPQPQPRPLHRPGSVDLVEDTETWADRAEQTGVRPIAVEGSPVDAITWAEPDQPVPDPVIGPEIAAARTRLGLSVDQLADRTRIRPHVIEAIEIDDFAPCGGDFYARGHLRTLARILGIDAAPLLAHHDERYADAPIDPRRVFEAELGAHSGAVRGGHGGRSGPSWSVLVAAVMAVVLAWSVVRLATDSTVELDPVPSLRTTGGTAASTGAKVPVTLTAAGGGAQVVVRDGDNELVYDGTLAFGEVTTLAKVSQPVRVQSSDGSLEVTVGDVEHGAMGATGRAAQNTFVAD